MQPPSPSSGARTMRRRLLGVAAFSFAAAIAVALFVHVREAHQGGVYVDKNRHTHHDRPKPTPAPKHTPAPAPAKPWFQFTKTDAIAVAATSFAGMGAAAGGIGGGVLFMPLMVLSGYDTHFAVLCSEAMIVGGMVSQFLVNSRIRHPLRDKPLIDYDVAMALLPPIIAGTIPGIFLNIMFQDWLILFILAAVLAWVFSKSYVKAKQVYEREKKARAAGRAPPAPTPTAPPSVPAASSAPASRPPAASERTPLLAEEDPKRAALAAIARREAETPAGNVALFALFVAAVMFLIYLPGKASVRTFANIERCSPTYWLAVAAPFPLIALASWLILRGLARRHAEKQAAGYAFAEEEVAWSGAVIARTAPYCFVLGIAVGVLGIGGGVMMTPVLLDLGVHPAAQAATSAFMIFFIATSAAVQFLVAGMLPVDYALLYAAAGLVAFYIGLTIINRAVAKLRMYSLIVITLCGLLLVACFLATFTGARLLHEALASGTNLGFHSVCTPPGFVPGEPIYAGGLRKHPHW